MDSIELCARFSYVTNKLEYCGPKSSTKTIYQYLTKDKNLAKDVKTTLEKFEGLMPYFSEMGGFNYKVVEAYWLGNELLENFPKHKMIKIINNLVKRGLPQFIAERIIEKLPSKEFPLRTGIL
ncbi:MAG: hypothetical protein H6502_05000 [Candidatus Woesearchaeota archaeon]|nr:MAG: hypothetical protein H6502_05000 [Candidatus Woesearchaeota archaeon]